MITQERLEEVLEYDAETGQFKWLVIQGRAVIGAVAGTRHGDGYVYIKIDKRQYRATRLVWLYLYGQWPKVHVDHINGNTSDDRRINLREATRSQNLGNRKLNENSGSGFKGVSRRGRRYRAYINKDSQRIWLGNYDTPEEAHQVYIAKARELFGEFARSS